MVKLRTFAGNPNNVVSPIYARAGIMENCLRIFPVAAAFRYKVRSVFFGICVLKHVQLVLADHTAAGNRSLLDYNIFTSPRRLKQTFAP